MQLFILFVMLISLIVSIAPLGHPETLKMVDEIQNSNTPMDNNSAAPMNSIVSGMVEGAQLVHSIDSVKRSAEEAARTVGRGLGQYIRGKYQQIKNNDLLMRFNETLALSVARLPLSAEEKQLLTHEVEQAYIQDIDNEKYELDQFQFRDLAYVIRKEYAEIILEKTPNGTLDTYDYKGKVKTRWSRKEGQFDGPAITYYEDGEIHFIDFYEKGRKISRKKYDQDGRLLFEQNYSYDASTAKENVSTEHHDSKPFEMISASSNPVALQTVPEKNAQAPSPVSTPKVRKIPVL